MLETPLSNSRQSAARDPRSLSERPVEVVFLPNVKMSVKRAAVIAEQGPDPLREFRGFKGNGVNPGERDLHNFPWNPLAKKGSLLAGLDLLRAVKVLLFDRNADIIVSCCESNVFFVLMLRRLFRFKPKVVVWDVPGRGWPIREKILDFVIPRADHVFLLTEDHRRKVEAQYKLSNPAQVVGFAVEDEFFRPGSPDRDERYVLAVGDDVSRDYPTLIEACRLAGLPLKLRSNAKFDVPEDVSHVTFVGRLSYRELRDLYEGASIVVVPLHAVDYPSGITALYEARSMGKPLVASRTGMTADFIRHGEDGVFVTPGSKTELSEALLSLWKDGDACKALGAAGRRRLEQDFSYNGYIGRFSMLLRQIAKV